MKNMCLEDYMTWLFDIFSIGQAQFGSIYNNTYDDNFFMSLQNFYKITEILCRYVHSYLYIKLPSLGTIILDISISKFIKQANSQNAIE